MHEECLVINPDSPHAPTVLTHVTLAKQSETENKAQENGSLLPTKGLRDLNDVLRGQSKEVFVHTLYRISNHHVTQGWSCPGATTQADFLYACFYLNSQGTESRGNYTLVHILTIMFSTSKCYEFLAIQAFTMKLWCMCTFLNLLLQMSVCFLSLSNQTGVSFSLWAQLFYDKLSSVNIHTVVALLSAILEMSAFLFAVLFWTHIFVVVIVKEWILLIYFTILSAPNHVCYSVCAIL